MLDDGDASHSRPQKRIVQCQPHAKPSNHDRALHTWYMRCEAFDLNRAQPHPDPTVPGYGLTPFLDTGAERGHQTARAGRYLERIG
jgi:hypothetical protein